MQVGKNWRIKSDPLNIILMRRHTTRPKEGKESKEYWTSEGYYSSLASALKGLVDMEVKETELKDLKTVMAKLGELYKLIEKVRREV